MKKLLLYILIFAMTLSLAIPAYAIDRFCDPSEDVSVAQECPYTLAFDPTAIEIQREEEALAILAQGDSATQRRTDSGDNLIFTGPFTRQYSIQPNTDTYFHVGIKETGKKNQYKVLLIYEGKTPTGEPVLSNISPFGTEGKGLYTDHIRVYTDNLLPGRYTLVTCTAEPKGSTLYPIDGTAFMTDIYCYKDYQTMWSIFAEDPTTHEKLDIIRLCAGENQVIAMGRSPLPCTNAGSISLYCPQELLTMEEAGGYIFLTPLRCGYGSLFITHASSKVVEIPLYVCSRKGGHTPGLSIPALEPTDTEKGLYVYTCADCGTVYRESVPSLGASFQAFRDVPESAWYYTSVREAYYLGLFKGVSQQEFKPLESMTRGMLVTVLWRREGSPQGAPAQFSDVDPDMWYAEAVNWAAREELVNGVGKGRFQPDGKITREQMATILYRYGKWKGLSTDTQDMVASYVDGHKVSSWARDAMSWNITHGMIGGVKEGDTLFLDPTGYATRSQVSAILVRFLHAFKEESSDPVIPDSGDPMVQGTWGTLTWSLYPQGVLTFEGSGSMNEIPNPTKMPWYAYESQVRELRILSGVESIGKNAFAGMTALERVIMADTVTVIEDCAFMECLSLKEIALSERLQIIGNNAFEGCISLVSVDLPYGLRQVQGRAFTGCTALKSISIPDSVTGYYQGKSAETLEGIGEEVFYGCISLEYAKLPVAVRHIPDRFFYNCSALKEVVMPVSLEFIGVKAFAKCASLESVSIMSNLTRTYEGAFAHCFALKNVYILAENYRIVDASDTMGDPEQGYPFGTPGKVTVYGVPGSYTEMMAERRGYTFRNIFAQ